MSGIAPIGAPVPTPAAAVAGTPTSLASQQTSVLTSGAGTGSFAGSLTDALEAAFNSWLAGGATTTTTATDVAADPTPAPTSTTLPSSKAAPNKPKLPLPVTAGNVAVSVPTQPVTAPPPPAAAPPMAAAADNTSTAQVAQVDQASTAILPPPVSRLAHWAEHEISESSGSAASTPPPSQANFSSPKSLPEAVATPKVMQAVTGVAKMAGSAPSSATAAAQPSQVAPNLAALKAATVNAAHDVPTSRNPASTNTSQAPSPRVSGGNDPASANTGNDGNGANRQGPNDDPNAAASAVAAASTLAPTPGHKDTTSTDDASPSGATATALPVALVATATPPPHAAPATTPAPATNAANADGWQAASAHAAVSGALTQAPVHVAVQTDSLGTVQVQAALRHNLVGATLTADRPEVQSWLGQQLPGLQRDLANKQVQVGSLQMKQQTAGDPGGQGQSGPPPRSPRTVVAPVAVAEAAAPVVATPSLTPSPTGGARLNLRA